MIETAEAAHSYRSGRMELNLDLGMFCFPKPFFEILPDVSSTEDSSRLSQIHSYVGRLEEERRKIDAFKRELPLCMLLLNEAIGRLKEEANRCLEMRGGSVASNRNFDEGGGAKVENDRKNWMSSAQLWISNTQAQSRNEEEGDGSMAEECKFGSRGGAFAPFMRPLGIGNHPPPPPPLSLMTPASDMMNCRVDGSKTHNQLQRKEQRRRWSPELHRKFIDALQRLGGSQVATPKQIREVMQVEGLTNDEVKSHLQKFRIHVRKLTPYSAAEAGEVRVNDQKHGLESQSVSRSDSPQGPLAGRGLSSSEAAKEDDDDEKSDGHSWKSAFSRKEETGLQL